MHRFFSDKRLKVDVALVPAQARSWRDMICIVVDVLRASSTIVTLFEKGASLIIPVTTKRQGMRVAREQSALLCGDTRIYASAGFDLENSPDEVNRMDFHGQKIVICTMNGSKVISRLTQARQILVGSYLNAAACCERAVELAAQGAAGIGVVCAGNAGEFALDDCVCAGYLAQTLGRKLTDRQIPHGMSESAIAALRLEASYPSLQAASADTFSGQWLAGCGQNADLTFCAQKDISQVAPIIERDGLIRIVR